MSVSHWRILSASSSSSSSSAFNSISRHSRLIMPYNQPRGGRKDQKWKAKMKADTTSNESEAAASDCEGVTHALRKLSVTASAQPHVPHRTIWKPKAYGTTAGAAVVEAAQNAPAAGTSTENKNDMFKANQIEKFTVDNCTYTHAQIRATFYPKFENEKSDQEIRTRMIEMVSKGLATLEVSLKHSGSLFMYAGHKGGAYAKNSFGNIYTAVGVFVLGRIFREAWGSEAAKKQVEFNDFLESNRMCISMELVTAVLGDHGQRPREDYGNIVSA